jgi:hypothetical protein
MRSQVYGVELESNKREENGATFVVHQRNASQWQKPMTPHQQRITAIMSDKLLSTINVSQHSLITHLFKPARCYSITKQSEQVTTYKIRAITG